MKNNRSNLIHDFEQFVWQKTSNSFYCAFMEPLGEQLYLQTRNLYGLDYVFLEDLRAY